MRDASGDALERLDVIVRAARESSAAVVERTFATARALEPRADCGLFFDVAGDELRVRAHYGERARGFGELALRRDHPRWLPALAARAGHHLFLRERERAMFPADRAAIAAPLGEGSPFALVYLGSLDARAFARPAPLARLLRFAATPYALALERERDRNEAMYDGLTGLLGPRAFRAALREEVSRCARGGASALLSLWFVDTDGFKAVNDTRGHGEGDRVLRQMAALLRAHAVPDVDVPARNGGDEFCLLLRATPKSVAVSRARAFAAAVRGHDFGSGIALTASVGVASVPFDANSAGELLERADAAMYHSKATGRDRVSCSVPGGRFAEFL